MAFSSSQILEQAIDRTDPEAPAFRTTGGGGGGGGDASAANQVTANTKLEQLHTDNGSAGSSPPALPSGASGVFGWLRFVYDVIKSYVGTAGTAATGVVTVQGIASMTALKTDASATTQPVSGTVTANAGTNLNTSTLALESGGNLAAAAASLSVLDDWDESDRAKVNPIAGQAGVAGGSGNVSALTQRVVLATDVALPAGTNLLGKFGIDQTTPGTTNLVSAGTRSATYTTPTLGSNIASTGLDSKADLTWCGPFLVDNSTLKKELLALEAVLGSFAASATAAALGFKVIPCLDGTNYGDSAGGTPIYEAIAVGTSAKRACVTGIRVPPNLLAVWVQNAAGGTTASSGNTLKAALYGYQAA